MIDGSYVPHAADRRLHGTKGVNMEKEGVVPDFLVETHPDQLAKGVDVQLEKAVTVLTQEVVAWKKREANGTVLPADGSMPSPVVGPPPGGPLSLAPAGKKDQ